MGAEFDAEPLGFGWSSDSYVIERVGLYVYHGKILFCNKDGKMRGGQSRSISEGSTANSPDQEDESGSEAGGEDEWNILDKDMPYHFKT